MLKASQNLKVTMQNAKAGSETLAQELAAHETQIVNELNDAQGSAMDIGGYYQPDAALASKAMRPSDTFNSILAKI